MSKEFAKKYRFYRFDEKGPESWIEDHIWIAITSHTDGALSWCRVKDLPDAPNPETNRSWKDMWVWQKENVIRPALARDEKGKFKNHTVVLCWPRGEGKSYLMNMMVLYVFFNLPKRMMVLGANSESQSRFVSYNIITELIQQSPILSAIVPPKDLREKEIRLRDGQGNIASRILAISSYSGIVSNITNYIFSEIFDMKNPKFFYQLDSSRRNITNSIGFIDSTVSEPGHVLHKLYTKSVTGADPRLFFSYYQSESGDHKDYHHPNMTQQQLDSFRGKFTPDEFRKYFKNSWDTKETELFKPETILAMRYAGTAPGNYGYHRTVTSVCKEAVTNPEVAGAALSQLLKLPYELNDYGIPRPITMLELIAIGNIYDTDLAISVGIDRADPLKSDLSLGARTVMTVTAKGLPGSRSNPELHTTTSPNYIYFVIYLKHIESNELVDIQHEIVQLANQLSYISTVCGERWGLQELIPFCVDLNIPIELIQPTYEKQRAAFNSLYTLIVTGHLKCPETFVYSKHTQSQLLDEELGAFQHDAIKKWYGSPQKNLQTGIQDDTVYSLAWSVYGARGITPDNFVRPNQSIFLGAMINPDTHLIGDYK